MSAPAQPAASMLEIASRQATRPTDAWANGMIRYAFTQYRAGRDAEWLQRRLDMAFTIYDRAHRHDVPVL